MHDVSPYNAIWETWDPEAVLRETYRKFGPRITIASSFSVEDTVIIHMACQIWQPVDVFWLDTGLLFAQTVQWAQVVAERYPVILRRIRPELTVDQQKDRYGPELWRKDPDQCCHIRKVLPLYHAVDGYHAWITGIRRDQSPTRSGAPVVSWDATHQLLKVNPLATWPTAQVYAYAKAHRVPINPLHAQGYPSFGCTPCTRPVKPGEDARAGRWDGFDKLECGIHQ